MCSVFCAVCSVQFGVGFAGVLRDGVGKPGVSIHHKVQVQGRACGNGYRVLVVGQLETA